MDPSQLRDHLVEEVDALRSIRQAAQAVCQLIEVNGLQGRLQRGRFIFVLRVF